MSNVGQAALTIAGFAVGSLVGFPQLGFIVGSLVGGALFPTKLPGASGPRLSDARTTTAQMGGPVMEVFGTDAVPGNVMWMDDLEEVTTSDEVGGKGPPTQEVTTYTYFQSIAIGICRGPMGGLLRIWENGVLVYDARPQMDSESADAYTTRATAAAEYAETFELYLGTEDQLPSPAIELDKGVGNVPAFRGLMYIVYIRRQLKEEQALRHPNFKFEVSQAVSTGSNYSTDVLDPWTDNIVNPIYDPGAALGGYSYAYYLGSGPHGTTRDFLSEALADGNAAASPTGPYNNQLGFHYNSSVIPAAQVKMNPVYTYPPGEVTTLYLHYNRYLPDHYEGHTFTDVSFSACGASTEWTPPITGAGSLRYWWSGEYTWSGTGVPAQASLLSPGVWRVHAAGNEEPGESQNNNCGNFPGSPVIYISPDVFIRVIRRPHKPEGTWTEVLGSFKRLAEYAEAMDGGVGAIVVTQYPLNPTLEVGSENDTQAYWEAAYASAVADGDIAAGLTYGVHYPKTVDRAWLGSTSAIGFPVALSEVVRPICIRCGLEAADVDVTDLEDDFVTGYTITRVMAGKDALDPLRQVGFFDLVESAGQIKFRQRGGPVNRRLQQHELGAGEIDQDGPAIKIKYTDETTLPRIIRVHYKAPSRDYEDGEQISPARATTLANNDIDVEVAVSITDDMAAQVAEVLWADAWEAGIQYEIALDQYHVDLEGGDVLEIPIDGFYERTRILDIDEAVPMLRQLRLARDYDGTFVSEAVSDPPEREPGEMRVFSQSLAILLDIPPLRVEDNDAGIYMTVRPIETGATWRSATVYRSTDAGVSFDPVGAVGSEPTTCTVLTPLGEGQHFTWDDSADLFVELDTGTLESRTEADVLSGANALAVGAHGRWEIVQFTTVEQTAPSQYRLSHLLRGRLGTEHMIGTGQIGDMAVLISGNGIVRVTLTDADIGLASLFKPVTSGSTYAAATDQPFETDGVALKPFAPVDLELNANGAGDMVLTWSRRDRLYQTLQGGVLPMSEDTEEYEVELTLAGDIIDAATVTEPTYIISPISHAYDLVVGIRWATADGTDTIGANQGSGTSSLRRYDAAGTLLGGAFVGERTTGFVKIGSIGYVTAHNGVSASVLYRFALASVGTGALSPTHTATEVPGDYQGIATDGDEVMVSLTYSEDIQFLDKDDLTVLATTAVTGAPRKLAVSADLLDLYVACASDEVAILDIATRAETARFACVEGPVDILVTPTLVFVQGTSQLGIYTLAGVVVDEIDITQAFSGGQFPQFLAYDGDRVLAIDGIATPLVKFYNDTTGALELARDLGVDYIGGFANGRYYFEIGTSPSPVTGKVYDGSLPAGYEIRVYQMSTAVGRGSPGVLQT